MNDAQSAIVTERMKAFQGETIEILAKSSPEANAFAEGIKKTLKAAGLIVPEPVIAGLLMDDNAAEPLKGLSIEMGVNRVDEATTLANAFRESGITDGPIRGLKLSKPKDADALKLFVRAKVD
jgi:hypothetical protein